MTSIGTLSSAEAQQAEVFASPYLAAFQAELAGALRRGDFPDVLAERWHAIFGLPANELRGIGRELKDALQLKSNIRKGRALGRLAARIARRYVPGGVSLDGLYGSEIEGFASALFDASAMYSQMAQQPWRPKFGLARAFKYLLVAAKLYTDRGVAPTDDAVVALAHRIMYDRGVTCSTTDVQNAFATLTQSLPIHAWLREIHEDA